MQGHRGPSYSQHRVIRALSRLFTLKLVGERGKRPHDRVRGAVERSSRSSEIEEHSDASRHELLQKHRQSRLLHVRVVVLRTDQRLNRARVFSALIRLGGEIRAACRTRLR
jgi:hypothetical protein